MKQVQNLSVFKCRYYNDHHTASSLMIDDLVPAAVSYDGNIDTSNDWGYLMDGDNSLYKYFNQFILEKYPEVKGTFFLPLTSQNDIPLDKGYNIHKFDVDSPEFIAFLHRISDRFEFAFHGKKHVFVNNDGVSVHEFRDISNSEVENIASFTKDFTKRVDIDFAGGKFPGYRHNTGALSIINMLDAKWWALESSMIYQKTNNDFIFDEKLNIVLVPTSICGDMYKHCLKKKNPIKAILRYFTSIFIPKYRKLNPQSYLRFLYKNRYPIIVQEHFQNQKVDGNRQLPNIYDDITSLDMIYSSLRGNDIWFATCGELARYYESYIHTTIETLSKKSFSIKYDGIYDYPFISLKSYNKKIRNTDTNIEYQGLQKNKQWVFNNVPSGNYTIVL